MRFEVCAGNVVQFFVGRNDNGDEFGFEIFLWFFIVVIDGWLQGGRGIVVVLGGFQVRVSFIFYQCSLEELGRIVQIRDILAESVSRYVVVLVGGARVCYVIIEWKVGVIYFDSRLEEGRVGVSGFYCGYVVFGILVRFSSGYVMQVGLG